MLIKKNGAIHNDFKLTIEENEISRVVIFRYLGINIRDNLKWNTHVESICGRIIGLIGAAKRLGNKLHHTTKVAFYHAMINSILTYLLPVWGTSISKFYMNKLQIVQNKAIRAIFKYEYNCLNLSTSAIRNEYKFLNIDQSVMFACATLMYKIENKIIKTNHVTERNNAHQYLTRKRNAPRLDAYRTDTGRLNIFRICTSIYNNLNPSTRNERTLNEFKKKLKAILFP